MKRIYSILLFLTVILLGYWTIMPLFLPGFFPIHDDTQVQRVYEMSKAIRDGLFPVRWVPDLGYGYGYPIYNFYAPFSYYFGALFVFLGTDVLIATKIVIGLASITSGITMFLLVKEYGGRLGGLFASILYMYAPYHAVNTYVRGDISESWAYAFIPLCFYGLVKIYKNRSLREVIFFAVAYGLVIISHNLTALMVTPFLVFFSLFLAILASDARKKRVIRLVILGILLGLSLSAFYWLPVITEMKYTNVLSQIGGSADFRYHFVCMYQLWESEWGFGGSVPGCVDGLSFKIGKLHVIFTFASFVLFFFIYYRSKYKHISKILLFMLAGFVVSVIYTTHVSQSIWEIIPFMSYLQYPWRFLNLVAFFSSVSAGILWGVLYSLTKNFKQQVLFSMFFFAALLVTLGTSRQYFKPQMIIPKHTSDYISDAYLRWITSKTSDEYMPGNFRKPQAEHEIIYKTADILSGRGSLFEEQVRTGNIQLSVVAQTATEVLFNIAYFPAWHIYLDNKTTEYSIADYGLIVSVPPGRHQLRAVFEQTFTEKLGNMLSLVGIVVSIIVIIRTREKDKTDTNEKTDS